MWNSPGGGGSSGGVENGKGVNAAVGEFEGGEVGGAEGAEGLGFRDDPAGAVGAHCRACSASARQLRIDRMDD